MAAAAMTAARSASGTGSAVLGHDRAGSDRQSKGGDECCKGADVIASHERLLGEV